MLTGFPQPSLVASTCSSRKPFAHFVLTGSFSSLLIGRAYYKLVPSLVYAHWLLFVVTFSQYVFPYRMDYSICAHWFALILMNRMYVLQIHLICWSCAHWHHLVVADSTYVLQIDPVYSMYAHWLYLISPYRKYVFRQKQSVRFVLSGSLSSLPIVGSCYKLT